MKVFALLHAESFDEISDVVKRDGHDGDIAVPTTKFDDIRPRGAFRPTE